MCGLELVAVVQLWALYHHITTGNAVTCHTACNAVLFVVSRIVHFLLRIISSGFAPHCAFDTGVKYGLSGWLCTPLVYHSGACAFPFACAYPCACPSPYRCIAR